MSNLSKKVQNFAHKNDLFKEKQRILVGVSGGADSVCLFHILLELAKKYDFSLHIAHVNYGLRGKDSDKDQSFVENLAAEYKAGISVLKLQKSESTSNLENELRNKRYAFFEEKRSELGFDAIAVAHNEDDQAETVLLRVIRGSGLWGMSAMKARNGKVIRPLLLTSRKEIIEYLKERKIEFRVDRSNLKPIFSRNKIRLRLIPYLEKNFNPNIKKTLAGLADNAAQDYGYISEQALEKLEIDFDGEGKASFSASVARRLHPAILRQGLRAAITSLKGGLVDIEAAHINEIEKIIKSNKGKTQKTSFKGLNIEKKGDIVSLLLTN